MKLLAEIRHKPPVAIYVISSIVSVAVLVIFITENDIYKKNVWIDFLISIIFVNIVPWVIIYYRIRYRIQIFEDKIVFRGFFIKKVINRRSISKFGEQNDLKIPGITADLFVETFDGVRTVFKSNMLRNSRDVLISWFKQ